ncbi:MAG: arsenate reductase/protein-tyrosine-phosphatase family protein [Sporichthyaceae bacterium]
MKHSTEDLTNPDAYTLLERISERLADQFAGIFALETVERYVFESYATLRRTAKVLHYLPILAEHFASERLTALAQSKGAIAKPQPEVLFVCVQNAGRSQLAAALLNLHAQGRVHVRSAGSMPASDINPVVVESLAELGIDVLAGAPAYPKPLTDDVVRAADVVITMGCGDACPVYPGKRYLNWDLADPKDRTLEEVRVIRDEIDARVRELLAEIAPIPAS